MLRFIGSILFLCWFCTSLCVCSHIRNNGSSGQTKLSIMPLQRLTVLRTLMAGQPTALAAYIIPTADAHNSEYISPRDARRSWLSGFTGSAGTAVVTSDKALVWTDGRYYTQFDKEVDLEHWTLMKQSLPDTPTMEKWLTTHLLSGDAVGVDPTTMVGHEWTPLKKALSTANMKLIAVKENLVDSTRRELNVPIPDRTCNEIEHLPIKYTGKKAGDKVKELRTKMEEEKAAALVITALDEVAYTLNLRGSDIQYNPVFYSYLVIKPSSAILFWRDGSLAPSIIEKLKDEDLNELECRPYDDIFTYLEDFAKDLSAKGDSNKSVWLSQDASQAIHVAAAGGSDIQKPLNLVSGVSPVALAKYVKNDVELQGFRNCHIRDGIAVIRFFKWLEDKMAANETVTEISAADKLLEFRKQEEDFVGPSFETISAIGENGAIIHYSPSKTEENLFNKNQILLLDSGGQYRDGTTDITRTRHLSGTPTTEQKEAFTRVLKGQIMMGSAVFPKGVKGNVLDSFARKFLWDVGLDYAHGTGHGVGHYLNVHEGPSGISWRAYPDDPGLKPGCIFSNEPGFYKVGEFGIRHEDLVEIISVTKDSDHPKASNLIGDFDGRGVLGFKTLTMVPNQKDSIAVHLLTDEELSYINNYHRRVLETVGPILEKRNLHEDLKWLQKECTPIKRHS